MADIVVLAIIEIEVGLLVGSIQAGIKASQIADSQVKTFPLIGVFEGCRRCKGKFGILLRAERHQATLRRSNMSEYIRYIQIPTDT